MDGAALPALIKPPLATAKPKISGGSKVGATLSCSRGKPAPGLLESFLYQRPVSLSYSWRRDGKRIAGATKHSIITSIITSGKGTYTCTVAATNRAGQTQKMSTSHKIKT